MQPILPEKHGQEEFEDPLDSSTSSYLFRKVTELHDESNLSEKVLELSEKPEDSKEYLGPNRLLSGSSGTQIQDRHQEWYLHLAILLSQSQNPMLSEKTKNQLYLAMLHGYNKAAEINQLFAEDYNIQIPPFDLASYHRFGKHELLEKVQDAYQSDMEFNNNYGLMMIYNLLFEEVLATKFHQPGINLKLSNKEQYKELLNQLFMEALEENVRDGTILINVSNCLLQGHPNEIEKLGKEFEDIFWDMAEKYSNEALQEGKEAIKIWNAIEQLREKLQIEAFTTYKKQPFLLIPLFLGYNSQKPKETYLKTLRLGSNIDRSQFFSQGYDWQHMKFYKKMEETIVTTGYRPSPDQIKQAWLNISDVKSILADMRLQEVEFAIKGSTIKSPHAFKNFRDLLNNLVMKNFKKMEEEDAPYLKILSKGTSNLLEGLDKCCGEKGIEKVFEEKGLTDLLQIFYVRLNNALADATVRRYEFEFYNHIEIIHQIIQDILAIAEPYSNDQAFSDSVQKNLLGNNSAIPASLISQVHLMPSAMHGVSSTVTAVEKQKGSNNLNVALLKDSYFESVKIFEDVKTYKVSTLDGDSFTENNMDDALGNPSPSKLPFDLFVCEFHHNFSKTRTDYHPEDVAGQVKVMYKEGKFAERFTVLIDTTIDLEQSDEVRQFLQDTEIQNLIKEGKLNVVLVRSAQKFDMLGMDNYYGGVSIVLNDKKSFADFNERMSRPEDQLRELSFQGMTHLQRYGQGIQDDYRKAIMKNTQELYKQLPKKAIYHEGTTNPMQISQINDPHSVFLDIKFDERKFSATGKAFYASLRRFAYEEGFPLTLRGGFGFINSNILNVELEKYRFTPGLESEEIIQCYAAFFQATQTAIDEAIAENKDSKTLDKEIAVKIKLMDVSNL